MLDRGYTNKYINEVNLCSEKDNNNTLRLKGKTKVESKLIYFLTKNDVVDCKLLYETTNNIIKELVPYNYCVSSNDRSFCYYIQDFIPVGKYISKIIKKDEFIKFLLNLINVMIRVEDRGIKNNNIYLNINKVFVHERSLKVKVICIPILNRTHERTIIELIKEIVVKTQFDYNENCEYVKDLLDFLRGDTNLELNIFKSLIELYSE